MSRASHNMPGYLGEIAELVGLDAADAVARAVGGTRAYIARRPDANHWLVRAIGAEKAAVVVEHFTTGRTGVELEFPVGPGGSYNRQKRERAHKIADLADQGLQATEIARRVGITRRGAQMALTRIKDRDPDQGTFDL